MHSSFRFVVTVSFLITLSFINFDASAQEIHKPSQLEWLTDFDEAKRAATDKGKYVMLYFSGSNWNKSSAQLDENILKTETFSTYAKGNFVPVKLDFPKMRKRRVARKGLPHSQDLAKKYNPNGVFPLLVFLNKNEEMIGFTGFTDVSPFAYVSIIESIIH